MKAYIYISLEKRSALQSKETAGALIGCLPHELCRIYIEEGKVVKSKSVRVGDTLFQGKIFFENTTKSSIKALSPMEIHVKLTENYHMSTTPRTHLA